ncbi:peptidyl-prolyl cis-trans isomerase [Evansella tamaricis]|uniref:Peptidyl-prolyl cis-trans isomerase n=1 Tax=Evansella tamaricis TaxID=2069301 RepID=A0ABS6JC72_9BACI|nr:peptidyl-prolyl cis-trans isomerase [Evansella tamaricis]MBU9711261.1 peptidyl-prolyl cis-trans isomerase [Evansella tamaricis]
MSITITGNVKHTITIDPGVWIFDERKVDLDTYFSQKTQNYQDSEGEKLAKAFDLHRKEGANVLSSNGNNITVSKKDLTEKSFGIPLFPFLENASPNEDVEYIIFKRSSGDDFTCPVHLAREGIIGFSKKGKPLKEDGPLHFYYNDGSNQSDPITDIINIVVS